MFANSFRWPLPEHELTNKSTAPHSGAEFGGRCSTNSALGRHNGARSPLQDRVLIVLRGLTRGNAQVLPRGPPQSLCDIDDLAHVVARVRERAMERCGDRERLTADSHGLIKGNVADVSEGLEQGPPAVFPLC